MVRVKSGDAAREIVDLLLESGVDPAHRANDGRQAWENIVRWDNELASYIRQKAGISLPTIPTAKELEAVCRPLYANLGSREPGVPVDDICSCAGQHGPAMYERIASAPDFNKVYPIEMSHQARLTKLLDRLIFGCAFLYTRTP